MDFDVIVIGSGVVGLACAAFLSETFSTLVIERNKSFGQETSSRNSEVIHSGIYYPPGTLKAKLCVEGNRSLYQWCQSHNIPHKKIGKYIVATDENEIPYLENLYKNAKSNNVDEIYFVSPDEIRRDEPNVKALAGLWSPRTGIVDSHKLMESLYIEATNKNCMFAFRHNVVGIEFSGGLYKIFAQTESGEVFSTTGKFIINSAGLESDTIAQLVGLNIEELGYTLQWAKGHYFRIKPSKSHLAKHLIYPVPPKDSSFLGVHLTVELDGNLKLGPDLEYLSERKQDYSVPEQKAKAFYKSASKYLSGLELEDLLPDQAGIRPKLRTFSNYPDFIIKEETQNGFPGFINLIGIESPGLTCCLEIGKLVKNLLLEK